MLTPEEYAKTIKCPVCNSSNFHCSENTDLGSNVIWRFSNCNDCKSTWNEEYQLIGYTNLKKGEDEKNND